MNYERIAQQVKELSKGERLQLAKLLVHLASEQGEQRNLKSRAPTSRHDDTRRKKRTAIDLDFQGFARAMKRDPLAKVADGVDKLCAMHGTKAAVKGLDRKEPWISKMRCIAKAVRDRTPAGTLVSLGKVGDFEMAYHCCLIEERNPQRMREIQANIQDENRQTVKAAWRELRPNKTRATKSKGSAVRRREA